MISCVFCHEPVNPLVAGSFTHHRGWTQQRKQGGANNLMLSFALNEVAHKMCIEDQKWALNQKLKLSPEDKHELRTCDECHEHLDPSSLGAWTEVTGWLGFRSRGGANAIALRQPTGLYLHDKCWQIRHASNQDLLF